LRDEAAGGIQRCVHLDIHHKSARTPLPTELRVWHGHIELLGAGDIALISLGGARDGTTNTDAHYKHAR
jgi:hypothetical protein